MAPVTNMRYGAVLPPSLMLFLYWPCSGWQKLCEGAEGLRRKVWTRTKILSLNIRYFVAILRFVAIYAQIFGHTKYFFGSKTVFVGQEMHYCMVYAYSTELSLQKCAKTTFFRKNSKYVLDENLYGHFRPRGNTANFCHPGPVVGVHHEENILKPEELLSCPIKISVHSRLLEEKNMAWLKGKSFGFNV